MVLLAQRREVIPEVFPLGVLASATPRLVGPFHEPVELVCGAARAGLDVLAEGGGVDAGLGGEVGFGELDHLVSRIPSIA